MIKIVSVAAMILASPIAAIAAPFCLVLPTGTPQCIYVDGASCASDAARQNGSCQVNASEVSLPRNRGGEYCLVMPSGASTCGYADGNVCARDAMIQKGACSLSAGAPPQTLPNDYVPNAGR